MNNYIKYILAFVLLISLFSFAFSANTGDLILEGRFQDLEMENILEILVFIIIVSLIMSILQETLGNQLPISPKAFKLGVAILIISFLWVLFSSFGGATFALIIGFFAEVTVILLGIGLFLIIRKKGEFYSPRTLYGIVAGFLFIVITNDLIFENFDRINGTWLGVFIDNFSWGTGGGGFSLILALIIMGLSIIGFQDKKRASDPVNRMIDNSEKIEDLKQKFQSEYRVLYQGITKLSKHKLAKLQEDDLKETISLLMRTTQKLLSISKQKINKTTRWNILNSGNPFNDSDLISTLNTLEQELVTIYRGDINQISDSTIDDIVAQYEELNKKVTKIEENIQKELQDFTQIQSYVSDVQRELEAFNNKLSDPKKKLFKDVNSKIKELLINELIKCQGDSIKEQDVKDKFIKSIISMATNLPQSNSSTSFKNDKIKDLFEPFKQSLSQPNFDSYWANYFQ